MNVSNSKRFLAVFSGMVLVLLVRGACGQANPACASVATMPNFPWQIALSSLNGVADTGSYGTLILNQAQNGNITGTWNGSCNGGTGSLTVNLSGAYQGNGQFFMSGSSLPGQCAFSISFQGTLSRVPACNSGAITFTYSGGGYGAGQISHSCYAPSTETTPVFQGFGYEGGEPTMATFRQSLVPTDFDWGGRYIYETSPPNSGSDGCWIPDNPDNIPKFDVVTGGGYSIVEGSSYGDDIGATEDIVNYYRAHQRAPCGFQVQQQVWIRCDPNSIVAGTPTTDVNFKNYTDSVGIGTTDVNATKGTVFAETQWLSPSTVRAVQSAVNQLVLKRHN